MRLSQYLNKSKVFYKASIGQRCFCALGFILIFGVFIFLWLGAKGIVDIGMFLGGPCGFKQEHGLPCPTCGMTTSGMAFTQGKVLKSFYIHPAGGFSCCLLVIAALIFLFTALTGFFVKPVNQFCSQLKIRYIVILILFIISLSWLVTLTRAFAGR